MGCEGAFAVLPVVLVDEVESVLPVRNSLSEGMLSAMAATSLGLRDGDLTSYGVICPCSCCSGKLGMYG